MKSLERITNAFRNGEEMIMLENERNDLSLFFVLREMKPLDSKTVNFFKNKYNELFKKICSIPPPKGVFERIAYKLGYKLNSNY
ncbi:MAG TPA: hypothetical protein VMV95_03440 [Bacillota bacterium]|nr:hypothetical protein [Bacillota bacterium]